MTALRMSREALLARRILRALGFGSSAALACACGGKTIDGGQGGASGNGGAGGASASAGAGGTSPEIFGCEPQPIEHSELVYTCVPRPGASCPPSDQAASLLSPALSGSCNDPRSCWCYDANSSSLCSCYNQVADVPCGPDARNPAECCYVARVATNRVCEGRPFVVGGEARVARAVSRHDWSAAATPSVTALSERARRALAAAWQRDGLNEHASIASFARFVLELLGLSAPAEIVCRAEKAMADEIQHAKLSFSLASAYAGESVGPGALPVVGGLEPRDLPALAAATAFEGCINETLAALVASAARDAASDPAVCAALDRIVADETEHATLAWEFVDWACANDRAAREAVQKVFDAAGSTFEPNSQADPGDEIAEALRAHGQLCELDRRGVVQRGLREVVVPCARALLARRRSCETLTRLVSRDRELGESPGTRLLDVHADAGKSREDEVVNGSGGDLPRLQG